MFDLTVDQQSLSLDGLFDKAALTAPGKARMEAGLGEAALSLIPNRPVNIADWGEQKIRLAATTSDRDGALRLIPYQRMWLEAMQEPGAEIIAIRTPPRAGKSTVYAIGIGYYTAHEGSDCIFWERTDDEAQYFHDKYLHPMLDSPAFEGLVRAEGEGVKDKWHNKIFKNGASWQLRSASTEGSMRQIKGRRLFCDEVSSKEWRSDGSGSKADRVLGRGRQYVDTVVIMASTPTDDDCVISAEYARSDQRVLEMPCPHCEMMQELLAVVGNKEGPGLKYVVDPVANRVTDQWYLCANEDCPGAEGADEPRIIRERSKGWMMDRAIAVSRNTPSRPGIIGFSIWSIHVFDPQSTWWHIATAHLESLHDPTKRQVFKNEWLALPWQRQAVSTIAVEALEDRAEAYPAEVPDGVRVITWGMDSQEGNKASVDEGGKPARHELTFWGWGYQEECWPLSHHVLDDHEPFSAEAGRQILELIGRDWTKRDGTALRAIAGVPDINYQMQKALNFFASYEVRKHLQMRGGIILPAVGKNEQVGSKTPLISDSQKARHGATNRTYWQLGTHSAKETLYFRQRLAAVSGPEVIHMPKSLVGTGFTRSFTAFRRKRDDRGRIHYTDLDGNEVQDTWVYGYAALQYAKTKWRDVLVAMTRDPERVMTTEEHAEMRRGIDMSLQAERTQAMSHLVAPRAPAKVRGVAPRHVSAMPQGPGPGPAAPPPPPRPPRKPVIIRPRW
ncbi:terminase gpA endonuclease subunit [uncultured Methylobacterium sp.]|uniref:terminase gpA endonuclease subunit n=1 Tax=uncultured Methylobacterium sp. TaxID=157278 RepID=UPI0035CA2D2C